MKKSLRDNLIRESDLGPRKPATSYLGRVNLAIKLHPVVITYLAFQFPIILELIIAIELE